MKRLPDIGIFLFSFGVLGIAVEHMVYLDFIIGRAPEWPATLPGRSIGAYLSGVAYLMIGTAIMIRKEGRLACIIGALLIFFWAFLRHLPVVAADDAVLAGVWTSAGKSVVFIGAFLTIASIFSSAPIRKKYFISVMDGVIDFKPTGRICLGVFLVLTGIQHFLYAPFVVSLMPAWFPGDSMFWTYFAGVALLAGGLGLLVPATSRLAALLSGLMIFSWVWLVHFPRIGVSVSDNIAVLEALAFSGFAFVLTRKPSHP